MKFPIAEKLLLTLGVAALAVGFGTSQHFYKSAMLSIFFGFTLASIVLIHLRVRPSWMDGALVLAGGAFFTLIDFGVLHFRPSVAGVASFLGITSLTILGLRVIWSEGDEQKRMLYVFVPSLLFVCSDWASVLFLTWTERAHPNVLDLYLVSFDASLGVQIPFVIGRLFERMTWLKSVSMDFYIGLPLVIALVYSGQLLRDRKKAISAMTAFLITGPIGVLFYNLFPALGPVHIFLERFPQQPFTTAEAAKLFLEPIAIPGLRNALPSLHMAWVLLAWWYSRKLSVWERGIALAFVFFTGLATVGSGEHYFIDLVVAFPFAVFLLGLTEFSLRRNDRARLGAVVFGLVATLGWIAALRFSVHTFWVSPALPWVCCIATIAVAIYIQGRSEGASDGVVLHH